MNYRDDAEDSPRKKKLKGKQQGKGGRVGRPAKQGGNAAAGGKRRGRPPANDKGKERERDREQPRQGDNVGNAAAAAGGASGSGSAAAGGGAAPSTDLHALDDAVGMAGVDLNVRETRAQYVYLVRPDGIVLTALLGRGRSYSSKQLWPTRAAS